MKPFMSPRTVARGLRALGSAAILCSCTPGPGANHDAESGLAPAPTASTPPDAASRPSATGEPDQRARAEINTVLQLVSRMRELPILGPVDSRIIDRQTMLRQVKEQVRSQVPQRAIQGESAFLRAFGFIPADYDYEAGVYGLIESQLAGYYDPDRKSMFLMDDLSKTESEVTLAHELVHALQDQHYDLGPRLQFRADANDEQAATHCLAEGDATSLMLDFILAESGLSAIAIDDDRLRLEIISSMALSPEMASFPPVLRDSLVAPYVDGVLFVHALRRRGGWARVDEVWRHPPATTEQVLHIDKYEAREPPETIPVPEAPARGSWTIEHTEVYGEQGLRVALEAWMPRRVAAKAAAGWAGDRAAVLSGTGQDTAVTVAAWHLRFDPGAQPDDEAKEASQAIASGWGMAPPQTCRKQHDGRRLALARHGRDLALVAGSAPSVAGEPRGVSTCAQLTRWAARIAAQK